MQIKTFDLNSLVGSNGFVIPGVAAGGGLGYSVSTVGDVNGDGLADLVLGALGANSGNGASYVLFGTRGGFPPSFDLANLDSNNGFIIPGIASAEQLGISVGAAGDVNGDNITDLVLGANNANSGLGASYVIFGSRGGFPPSFNLTTLNGNNGFSVSGVVPSGELGVSVSTVGDINGDGIDDLVLGAEQANSGNGASYVLFGTRGGFPPSFNLTNLNGSNGFVIPGVATNGYLGGSVSTAGDVNDDGLTDLVLGANGANSGYGASYVLFGTRGGFPPSFNLVNLNGSNGFVIPGVAAAGRLGGSVSTAGDVNGDGIADLVLGAFFGANSDAGASYVIFGSRSGFPATFDLTTLNGANGFTIPGIATNGNLGWSVSTAGDVNGDGLADLVLGAPGVNSESNGISYVVFGSRSGFSPSFNLAHLNGSNGFVIPGIVAGGYLGWSVSTAGDVNGDGLADLVLGAGGVDSGNGAIYVLFGGLASTLLTQNVLVITEGQTVIFSNTNLNAFTLSAAPFSFIVTGVQGGRFTLVNDSATSLFNFTQTQINSGQIQFISDRANVVAYQVGFINSVDGKIVIVPTPANVTFIHHPPVVINPPTPNTQIAVVGELFNFAYTADSIFNDTDGDPLTYSAGLNDGSSLPNWLQFNAQTNQLSFSGIAPDKGSTAVSLIAKDPLNASVSTGFDLLAVPGTGNNGASTAQIVGGVVGGAVVLGGLIGAGLGFWRYVANKNTRKGEQFADAIRTTLNLRGVDDFESEAGQQFVGFVYSLQNALKEAGLNTSTMRVLELRQLANDVADAARNKISSSMDCLGRSVITVMDLNDNLQALVNEVQILRAGGKQNAIQ